MADSPNPASATTMQKAAMVISALGTENASQVFKYFTDDEIEKMTLEVAKMDYWPMEVVDEVLNDFYEICLTQKVISEGGIEYAREILEKAFGPQQASALFDKITKQLKTKAFAFVRRADYKNLLAIVQNEHPQTIALILSYARSDQASAILSELPKEIRIEVVERIAKMESASPEVIKSIEATLEKKFANLVTTESMEVGGINYIADVLNKVERSTEKYIFDELNLRDPKLAEEIRQKMFVFEDIVHLDSMSIQAFIPQVEPKDLAVAIKGSTAEVAEVIYANMSARSKESTQTDVEYLHNVRMRDVEEAQQRIVAIIRRLEDEGKLTISKGGSDEIIA
ncbi:MAG: flagellar motor switch protein FliG [Ruminiclostridium sp.]|nr:flagellar motor switch protein FliG [Ruminiclostridium sp.]MBQ8410406.1 flagellar motor switch protein FliG [Ruminiclostridium sp.]